MPRYRPKPIIVEDMDKEYPTTIGIIMLYSTPNSTPVLKKSRVVFKDEFGGTMTIGPLAGMPLTILRRYNLYHEKNSVQEHANFVLHYRIHSRFSMNSIWWEFLKRIRTLSAYAALLSGPYILDDISIAYLKLDGQDGMSFRRIENEDTQARCSPPYALKIKKVPKEYDTFISACKALVAALGPQLLFIPHSRWKSKDKAIHQGTRLERAVVMLGHATVYQRLYDLPLRLQIALESLFQSSQLDLQSVRIVTGMILRDRVKPEDSIKWGLALAQWRNHFVHGDAPPYYYPPASPHTEKLVHASECGLQLLSNLILEIISDPELTAMFNTAANDHIFARSIYNYCTSKS